MKLKTRDLLVKTLRQMGCKCHVDGNEICFNWQGEQFYADAENNILDVNIWYHWLEMELKDTASIQRWKDIINNANNLFHAKAIYAIDEAENSFCIYNEASFFLFPQVTDKQLLVRVILERLLSLRRYMEMAFDKDRHGKRPMSDFEKEFPFMAFSMELGN